jgi:hypothetical protein
MTAGPDLVHNDIIDAMIDQFPRTRWRRLQTQDIAILEEASEPQPDLVILERGAGPASGRLLPSEASHWSSRSSPGPALTGTTSSSGRSTPPGKCPSM